MTSKHVTNCDINKPSVQEKRKGQTKARGGLLSSSPHLACPAVAGVAVWQPLRRLHQQHITLRARRRRLRQPRVVLQAPAAAAAAVLLCPCHRLCMQHHLTAAIGAAVAPAGRMKVLLVLLIGTWECWCAGLSFPASCCCASFPARCPASRRLSGWLRWCACTSEA